MKNLFPCAPLLFLFALLFFINSFDNLVSDNHRANRLSRFVLFQASKVGTLLLIEDRVFENVRFVDRLDLIKRVSHRAC